jgi:hypothetical protein
MTTSLYLLHALGWSTAGAIVGVLLDRGVLALQQIAHATMQEEPVDHPAQPHHHKPVRRRFGRSVVPAVLLVLAVVTAVQGVVTARTNAHQDEETRRVQNCQLAYANGFADALDARAEASVAAQDALDELMTTVGTLTAGGASPEAREKFRAALSDYLQKRVAAKQRQKDNPYPPAPRDLCK